MLFVVALLTKPSGGTTYLLLAFLLYVVVNTNAVASRGGGTC